MEKKEITMETAMPFLEAIATLWNLKLNKAKDLSFAIKLFHKFYLLNYIKLK